MSFKILMDEFLGTLGDRQGVVARNNGTFFAHHVVTTAIQRLRIDFLNGINLNHKGYRFVMGAAAYLAYLANRNWKRRGFEVKGHAEIDVPIMEQKLSMAAYRVRGGITEEYRHDFLQDALSLLIKAPQNFPSMHGNIYIMDSLTYPSPEYLYMYGVFTLYSPSSSGNWPRGTRVGGLDEDFAAARNLLVDDLHTDCGLPLDHEGMRKLSWWVVFPTYGWQMNDGQEYNMMTLVDQIFDKKVVTMDEAIEYLRAIAARSQLVYLRNLAARTLMLFDYRPADYMETIGYEQALNSRDHQMAEGPMMRFRWQMDGNDPKAGMTEDWIAERRKTWNELANTGPMPAWRRDPILTDPYYIAMGQIPKEEPEKIREAIEYLLKLYPDNWFLRSGYGSFLMEGLLEGTDPSKGEAMLRRCVEETPDCPDAHLNLGTRLKWQGRRDEAMRVFEDGVRRWPYHAQMVDSCMWLLTDDMVMGQ